MKLRTRKASYCNHRGMTLVELAAAVSLASLVTAMVITAWQAVDRHIAVGSRRMMLQAETVRISSGIVTQLGRSNRLIAWHYNGISFQDENGVDTLSYEMGAQGLLHNGEPVPLVVPRMKVNEFSIELEESGTGLMGPSIVFALTVGVQDSAGKSFQVKRLVSVTASADDI